MQRPLMDRQMNAGFISPLHSSTNPEILVKILSVVPEIKKNNYIARRRGMPGCLKKTTYTFL